MVSDLLRDVTAEEAKAYANKSWELIKNDVINGTD